jgi:predicted nucleic acid-binding protein
MPTLILDSDFLSSFLKIDRCDLIKSLYQVKEAFIPTAVHREIAQTDLLTSLLQTRWISVLTEKPSSDQVPNQEPTWQALGAGEQACILVACTLLDVILLMNDNKARRVAQSLGVTVINIPAFLMACKMAGLVSPPEMSSIIKDLKTKDYYAFKPEVRDLLLE